MIIFELPPPKIGTTQEQIDAIRDYLVRLAFELTRQSQEEKNDNNQMQ